MGYRSGIACALLLVACGDGAVPASATTSGSGGATASASTTSGASTSSGGGAFTTSGAAPSVAASSSSGSPGSSGSASSSSSSSGGGTKGCAGLPLCDDFEGAAVGGPPDPATWAIVSPSCSGTGTIAVDDTEAHSGTKSVKVTGKGGYCNHVFMASTTAPEASGKVVYGRFFLRLADALGSGHTAFLTMKDAADGGKDLRLGGQSQVLIWNRESDDATLPSLSPTGIALSVAPRTGQWLCVELRIDQNAGTMQTWVDGAEVAGLHEDGVPTPDVDQQWLTRTGWKPSLTDLKLGWESYAGQDLTLWFDDVAMGPTRIGCD